MSEVKSTTTAPLYVSFKIEKAGSGLEHEIKQVGVAWGRGLEDGIKTFNIFFKQEGPYEERCAREFWDKNVPLRDKIEHLAVDAKAAWAAFTAFLDFLESESSQLEILSDNPSSDLAAIDYNLFARCQKRLGVRFTKAGEIRVVSDPSEQIRALSDVIRKRIRDRLDAVCSPSHWAPDNAKRVLLQHFYVRKAIQVASRLAMRDPLADDEEFSAELGHAVVDAG